MAHGNANWSVITSKLNGLNATIKRQRLAKWIFKKQFNYTIYET